MKILTGKITEVILDEEEKILVSTLKGNKQKIYISVINGALNVDNITVTEINQLQEEKKMIETMNQYKKERNQK